MRAGSVLLTWFEPGHPGRPPPPTSQEALAVEVGAGLEAPLTCPLRSPPAQQVLTSTTRKPAARTWRRASTKRPSRSLLRLVKLENSQRRKASLGGGRGATGLTVPVLGGLGSAGQSRPGQHQEPGRT